MKLFDVQQMRDNRYCIDDKCKAADCERITDMVWAKTGAMVPVCTTYIKPTTWFRNGKVCPMIYKEEVKVTPKGRVGQQKQKKKK